MIRSNKPVLRDVESGINMAAARLTAVTTERTLIINSRIAVVVVCRKWTDPLTGWMRSRAQPAEYTSNTSFSFFQTSQRNDRDSFDERLMQTLILLKATRLAIYSKNKLIFKLHTG